MALGSTQPVVKMSTRNISWGKGGRCVRLTTSPPSSAECHEIWKPKPPGTLWATPGLLRDSYCKCIRYMLVVSKITCSFCFFLCILAIRESTKYIVPYKLMCCHLHGGPGVCVQ